MTIPDILTDYFKGKKIKLTKTIATLTSTLNGSKKTHTYYFSYVPDNVFANTELWSNVSYTTIEAVIEKVSGRHCTYEGDNINLSVRVPGEDRLYELDVTVEENLELIVK